MHIDAHAKAIRNLGSLGPLRVWSLLVTVFGDLAPDCALSGLVLSAIMEGIGIKPEATRVALHRLRSDDWISSQKVGRTSLHSLTQKGQSDSADAQMRIYGSPTQMGREAVVFITSDSHPAPDLTCYLQISARTFITAKGTPLPKGAMHLLPTHVPDWLGQKIEPAALRDSYATLHSTLALIDAELWDGTVLPPRDIAVLRVMIVHAWRRLALKHPDLPRDIHSKEWRGHDCRALVTTLLGRFPRPALQDIKAT